MSDSEVLATDACDRATAYHMSNKTVRHPDGVFVTWLDSQYRAIIAQVDPDSGKVLMSVPLAQGYDNHCGAALALTPDNRLHVITGGHGTCAFNYRYSDTPCDPASWSLPQSVGSSPTYPSLVAMPDNGLVLSYRHSSPTGRWGAMIQHRSPEGQWSWAYMLMWPAAERYTFPTNALKLGEDGVLHIGLEFYKTYPPDTEEAKSVAVTHAYSEDGGFKWSHDDDRTITCAPFGIEDAFLVDHNASGNLRPANLAVFPDGRVAVAIWNARCGTLDLFVRNAPGAWTKVALTEEATACGDGWTVNSHGRLAIGPGGELTVITTVSPELGWGRPGQQVRCLWLDGESLEVKRTYLVPKEDSSRAAWLASIEHSHTKIPDDPLLLLYTDGTRGEGCINEALCNVRMLKLTDDLAD